MYSNLTLYYLDHLGITPWVKKESSISLQATHYDAVKLVILLPEEPRGKAQSLFKQLLTYINIADNDLQIIKKNEVMSLSTELEKYKPHTLLSLGDNIRGLNITCPVLEGVSLDYLLTNPFSKRDIFQKITALKALI